MFAKSFFISIVFFLALDWVWFKLFMGKLALNELRPILKLDSEGGLDVNIGFAICAYIVMALFVAVFLEPKIKDVSFGAALGYSALMGFLVFGIFDFTNAALFRSYSNIFILADVAWGTFIYTMAGAVLWKLNSVATS